MKVFISHSSHDKWVARQISRLLESAGHDTFLDEKDIRTGDSIDVTIQEHLKDSDDLLLLLSPASIKSHWVFIELGGAKALGKRIIPILLHVGANEVPAVIAQALARDINELEKYIEELSSGVATKKRKVQPRSRAGSAAKSFPSASEFKRGDRVRIALVEHLSEQEKLASPVWVPPMDKFSGLETKVLKVFGSEGVRLEVDDGEWTWGEQWLTRVA